jgi:hypothetical protein
VAGGWLDVGGIGISMDSPQPAERLPLVPARLLLPSELERLVRLLPGLLPASSQQTHVAEPCHMEGLRLQRAGVETFLERLLQERAPVDEVARERVGIAQAHGDGTVEVPLHPAHRGQHGQHLAQLGPIVEVPGQGLGLAQHGAAPPLLSHREQHVSEVAAELNGQAPGVGGAGRWASTSIARSKAVTASGNAARSAALSPACRQ